MANNENMLQPEQVADDIKPTQDVKEVLSNPFHQAVAEKYNQWALGLKQQSKNLIDKIYRPVNFNGDWQAVDPEEYIVHRLSIMGVYDQIRPSDVGQILHEYKTNILTDERLKIVQLAYELLNKSVAKLGLSAGQFDLNKLVFVSSSRVSQIASGGLDGLAYTLEGKIGEVLIPYDNEELNSDDNQLFDVVVHELGHQVRHEEKLDPNGSMILEEGIVQAQARAVEKADNKISARTNEVYVFEAQVAEELAAILGYETLFNVSHATIREKMRSKYLVPGFVSDPYDDLIYGMAEYRRLFSKFQTEIESVENIPKQRVQEMKAELRRERQVINQNWGFQLN